MIPKRAFCCWEYQQAFEHGIQPKYKVPDIRNYPKYKDVCSFCGKDPQKYWGSKISKHEI